MDDGYEKDSAVEAITRQMDHIDIDRGAQSPVNLETYGFGGKKMMAGSEKRRFEENSDDEFAEELKDTVGAYP